MTKSDARSIHVLRSRFNDQLTIDRWLYIARTCLIFSMSIYNIYSHLTASLQLSKRPPADPIQSAPIFMAAHESSRSSGRLPQTNPTISAA
jgi:hypothetical protein